MSRLAVGLCALLSALLALLAAQAAGGEAAGLEPPGALSLAPAQSTATPAPALAPVVLVWTTKSEINTAGFYVYRAEQPGGPFLQVNRDLIPASNDAAAGGTYRYTDTTTLRGLTYYYALEDVETSGQRSRHEPIKIVAGESDSTLFGLPLSLMAAGAALLVVATAIVVWRKWSR